MQSVRSRFLHFLSGDCVRVGAALRLLNDVFSGKRYTIAAALAAILVSYAAPADAALIKFLALGHPDVTGFVEFDDTNFSGGTFDAISNSDITNLQLTAFGAGFVLADVVTTDTTFINSSGIPEIIENGGGLLANNGSEAIAFFPDGFGGSAFDGDASLAFSVTPTFGPFTYHAVRWVVPEPSTALLLGVGLLGLAARGRRRKA